MVSAETKRLIGEALIKASKGSGKFEVDLGPMTKEQLAELERFIERETIAMRAERQK